MSRQRGAGRGTGDAQQQVREAPRPQPDPAFTARLRQEFLRRSPAMAPVTVVPLKSRRAAAGVIATALATAAAIALVWVANQGPGWKVHAIAGTGLVRLDGVAVDAADRAGVQRRLHSGVVIEVPESVQLDLVLPGTALLQLTSGTRVVLPTGPGRWFARSMRGRVDAGELRIATGPSFRGARLVFEAATSEVRITGTTLAILAPPEGACVCVFEGRVEMRDSSRGMARVIEGTRRVVYRDARSPLTEPIRPMESAKLGMLHQEAERTLGSKSVGHILN